MTEEVLHADYAMISLFNRKYMVARPSKFLTFGLPCFRHPFDNLAFLVLCQPREPGALLSSTMSANDYECSCFSLGRSQEVDLIVGIAKHTSITQRRIWRILNPRHWVRGQNALDFVLPSVIIYPSPKPWALPSPAGGLAIDPLYRKGTAARATPSRINLDTARCGSSMSRRRIGEHPARRQHHSAQSWP